MVISRYGLYLKIHMNLSVIKINVLIARNSTVQYSMVTECNIDNLNVYEMTSQQSVYISLVCSAEYTTLLVAKLLRLQAELN